MMEQAPPHTGCVISILGASTLAAMLPSLIVNVIILVYALSPGVKDAFDWEGKRL